jgi:hypothetical protein
MATFQEQAQQLYQNNLGRQGDAEGVNYFANQLASGASPESVQKLFQGSAKSVYQDYLSNPNSANSKNPEISALLNSDLQSGIAPPGTQTGSAQSNAQQSLNPNIYKNLYGGNTPAPMQPAPMQNFEEDTNAQNARLSQYQGNPYLDNIANDVQRRSGQALDLGLQGIRSNAVGIGGLGGSRQGVAEGLAIGQANDNLSGNLSNLYGQDFTNSQNRNLQKYGIDTNADLTRQGQQQNFYTANRGLDQQGLQIGANLFNQGNQGRINQGQGIYGIGNTEQQAPFNVFNNANQTISPYAGAGSSNTSSSSQGGGLSGIAGGAFAGAQIGRNLGFGGGSDPYNVGQGSSYNGNYSRM